MLRLARQAVASSGRVGDHVRVGGVNYARIVHAGTGRGSQNLAAVTVVARRAWQATALARTAAVLGPTDGRAMLRVRPRRRGLVPLPPERAPPNPPRRRTRCPLRPRPGAGVGVGARAEL